MGRVFIRRPSVVRILPSRCLDCCSSRCGGKSGGLEGSKMNTLCDPSAAVDASVVLSRYSHNMAAVPHLSPLIQNPSESTS